MNSRMLPGIVLLAGGLSSLVWAQSDVFETRSNLAETYMYTETPCVLTCTGWVAIGGEGLTVTGAGLLYQIPSNGPLSIMGYLGGTWIQLDNSADTEFIFAGTDGSLYQTRLDADYNLSFWAYIGTPCNAGTCLGWMEIDNQYAINFSAGPSGVFETRPGGQLFQYVGPPCYHNVCSGWVQIDNNPLLGSVVSGAYGAYQMHTTGSIWQYTGQPCNAEGSCPGWRQLDDNPNAAGIVAGQTLYQNHFDGTVWKYTGPACNGSTCSGWTLIGDNPNTTGIYAGVNDLYAQTRSGELFKYDGLPCIGNLCQGWVMIDNTAYAQIAWASLFGSLP